MKHQPSTIRDLLGRRMPAVTESLRPPLRALTIAAASSRGAVLAAGVSAVLACVPAMAATSFTTGFDGPSLDGNLATTYNHGGSVTVNGQAVLTNGSLGGNDRIYVGTVDGGYATSAQNWTATIEVLAPVGNQGNFFGLGSGTTRGGGNPDWGTPQGATVGEAALYIWMGTPAMIWSADLQRKTTSTAYWDGFPGAISDATFDSAAGTTGGVAANAFYRYSMAYDAVGQTVTFDVEQISGFGGTVTSTPNTGNLYVVDMAGMGFTSGNGRIFFGGDNTKFDNLSVNVVPEPATALVGGLGLLGLLRRRR